ncbi:Sex peptide receptor [Eumeta japonica]|uniref:Sex peptide receptor n=1 Tax=Eumeta variegata TaxID=151549 RepID=A0A4C1UIC6_EUMVA|nr:Sex peptide receptor [Eumeta japonica]
MSLILRKYLRVWLYLSSIFSTSALLQLNATYIAPFLLATTTVANTLIVVVLSRRHMRTPTNAVLMTMALCDMFTLLFPAPWLFYMYTFGNHYKPLAPVSACQAWNYMNEPTWVRKWSGSTPEYETESETQNTDALSRLSPVNESSFPSSNNSLPLSSDILFLPKKPATHRELSRRLQVSMGGNEQLLSGCVRPLSLFYSDASADGVEERSLVPRSRSHARLRRNATMSHAFSYVQPAFIDL